MAKKFEFAKIEETLDIAGHTYTIDCNDERILAAMDKFGDNCIALSKRATEYSEDKFIELCKAEMTSMLNAVLGEGMWEDIFAVRGKNFFDMNAVCTYICESLFEARNNHASADIVRKCAEVNARISRSGHKGKGKNHRGKPRKMTARVMDNADKYTDQSAAIQC